MMSRASPAACAAAVHTSWASAMISALLLCLGNEALKSLGPFIAAMLREKEVGLASTWL